MVKTFLYFGETIFIQKLLLSCSIIVLDFISTISANNIYQLILVIRPHILHIDDNKDFLEIVQLLIHKIDQKVKITGFTSPVEVLKKVDIKKYSILICDYQMPEISTFEFITKIRNISTSIPIVLLTAMDKEQIPKTIFFSNEIYYVHKTIYANAYLIEIINLAKKSSSC